MSPLIGVKITKFKPLSDTEMETGNNFDYERFKEEAIQGLSEGKKWGGADGVFGPMLKHLLESMLEGELNHHLAENKATGVETAVMERQKRRSGVLIRANWKSKAAATARGRSRPRSSQSGS